MKRELESIINYLRTELYSKIWNIGTEYYQQGLEERLKRLEQLYDDLYKKVKNE